MPTIKQAGKKTYQTQTVADTQIIQRFGKSTMKKRELPEQLWQKLDGQYIWHWYVCEQMVKNCLEASKHPAQTCERQTAKCKRHDEVVRNPAQFLFWVNNLTSKPAWAKLITYSGSYFWFCPSKLTVHNPFVWRFEFGCNYSALASGARVWKKMKVSSIEHCLTKEGPNGGNNSNAQSSHKTQKDQLYPVKPPKRLRDTCFGGNWLIYSCQSVCGIISSMIVGWQNNVTG